MPTQVDPAAFTNAFNLAVDRGQQERQLGIQNTRARLHDMYMANQDQRAAAAEGRAAQDQTNQQTQFTQEQQISNTRLLNMAAAEIARDPGAATRWGPQLEKAGIVSGEWQRMPPEMLQQGAKQLFESTSAALQAYEQQAGPGAQRETADIQNWRFVQNLSPEQRKEWLTMQRQPTVPRIVAINGVQHLVDPIQGTMRPLSSVEAEAMSQGQIAEGKAIGTARGEAQGGLEKKAIGVQSVNNILDIAEPLIEQATGSTVGAVSDAVAAFFGKSLTGAQAIAQLRALEANLILAQPRMEGPQSNADALRYEQAAAQIGDPKVPRETKIAAIKAIRALQAKYSQGAAARAPAPAAAPSGGGVVNWNDLQ